MTDDFEPTETQVLTGVCRLAFASLFRKTPTIKDGEKLAYQATILFPDTEDLDPVLAAMEAATVEKWPAGKTFTGRAMPLHNCNEKPELEGYDDGWHWINVKTDKRPQVIRLDGSELVTAAQWSAAATEDGANGNTDATERLIEKAETECGSGVYCRFFMRCFAWDKKGIGKGLSFQLESVQLVKDGPRFDGRKDAKIVFGTVKTAAPKTSKKSAQNPFG